MEIGCEVNGNYWLSAFVDVIGRVDEQGVQVGPMGGP